MSALHCHWSLYDAIIPGPQDDIQADGMHSDEMTSLGMLLGSGLPLTHRIPAPILYAPCRIG